MKRRSSQVEEPLHPFRSLFDLMLGLTFALIAIIVLQRPYGQGTAQYSLIHRRDEMLLLHNLERKKTQGEATPLLHSILEIAQNDPCRRLLTQNSLDTTQRNELEVHREALWEALQGKIQERLLTPPRKQQYGQDRLNFAPGSDVPTDQSRLNSILAEIRTTLKSGYKRVRVQGHTDSVPVKSERFASNWELSSARAIWLTRKLENYLQQSGVQLGEKGVQLEAIGYGERKPIADNRTEVGRRQNRRIEIVFEQ